MNPDQASPIDIPPRISGETLIPAVLDRTLRRPNSVGGSGAGPKASDVSEEHSLRRWVMKLFN